MMIGMKEVKELFQKHFPEEEKGSNKYDSAINRFDYEIEKSKGKKPKFHKGARIDSWYTCGNCGSIIKGDVCDNFCWKCGYKIKWDSPRCLTK